MIRFSLTSVYDAEGVCPGDILRRKGTDQYYFVADTNVETEEFICILKEDGKLRDSTVARVGYEKIDLYDKIRIYDATSE